MSCMQPPDEPLVLRSLSFNSVFGLHHHPSVHLLCVSVVCWGAGSGKCFYFSPYNSTTGLRYTITLHKKGSDSSLTAIDLWSHNCIFLHCRLYCLCPVFEIHNMSYVQLEDTNLKRCDRELPAQRSSPWREAPGSSQTFSTVTLGYSQV